MKTKNILKVVSGVAASSFLFQACDNIESADMLNQKIADNKASISSESMAALPSESMAALPLNSVDSNYLEFISNLANSIVINPTVAKEFSKDPDKYCIQHGYNVKMNLNDGFLRLIIALGDDDLNKAVKNDDINSFVRICKEKGLLNTASLLKSPYLEKISDYVKEMGPITPLTRSSTALINNQHLGCSFIYGFVAIAVAVAAAEAFIVIGTTCWVTHINATTKQRRSLRQSLPTSIKISEKIPEGIDSTTAKFSSDEGSGSSSFKGEGNDAVVLWNLKTKNPEMTYQVSSEVNNTLANEGVELIKNNYPEVYNKVDKNMLRNIILTNIQCND